MRQGLLAFGRRKLKSSHFGTFDPGYGLDPDIDVLIRPNWRPVRINIIVLKLKNRECQKPDREGGQPENISPRMKADLRRFRTYN